MFGKARNTLGYNRKWAEFQPNNLRECSGIVLRRKGDTRCEEFAKIQDGRHYLQFYETLLLYIT